MIFDFTRWFSNSNSTKTKRPWELLAPDVMSAVEFCREKILEIQVEQFELWFKLKKPEFYVPRTFVNRNSRLDNQHDEWVFFLNIYVHFHVEWNVDVYEIVSFHTRIYLKNGFTPKSEQILLDFLNKHFLSWKILVEKLLN